MKEEKFLQWSQLIHCRGLKPNDKVLLLLILDYHNIQVEGGKWNNTSKTILMREANIADTATGDALKRLKAKGLIGCDKDRRESADHYYPILGNIKKIIEQSIEDRKKGTNVGKSRQGRLENQSNQGLEIKPNTNINNTKSNYSIYTTKDNKDLSVPTTEEIDIPNLGEEDIERFEQLYYDNPFLDEANDANPSDNINSTNQEEVNPNSETYNRKEDNFNDTSNTPIASTTEDTLNPIEDYNINSASQTPSENKQKVDRIFDLLQEIIDERKKDFKDKSSSVSKYNEYLELNRVVTLTPNQQTAIENKMKIVRDLNKRSPFIPCDKCLEMQEVYEGIINIMSDETPIFQEIKSCAIAFKATEQDYRYLRGFESDYLLPYFEKAKKLINTKALPYMKANKQ